MNAARECAEQWQPSLLDLYSLAAEAMAWPSTVPQAFLRRRFRQKRSRGLAQGSRGGLHARGDSVLRVVRPDFSEEREHGQR